MEIHVEGEIYWEAKSILYVCVCVCVDGLKSSHFYLCDTSSAIPVEKSVNHRKDYVEEWT